MEEDMLNIKYYKDLSHNFLILQSKIKEEEQDYQYKMISGNKIKHLLECKIRQVNEECELDSFLLDSRCLLLMPECIYVEPETKQYFFLYYPCADEEDKKEGMLQFAQFLVDRAEHEQEETVEMAYKIYEAVQDEVFILPHILSMFRPPAVETKDKNCPQNVVEESVEADVVNADFWMEGEEDYGENGYGNDSKEESLNYL